MRQTLIKYISEFYEILFRLMVFLIVSYGVTLLFENANVLTASLWITMSHWVYGGIQATTALIIVVPFFSPESFYDVWSRWVVYMDSLKEKYAPRVPDLFHELRGMVFQERVNYIAKYVEGLYTSNNDLTLEPMLKAAKDGLELAVALTEDSELPVVDKSYQEEISWSKTWTLENGKPGIVSTVTLEAETSE